MTTHSSILDWRIPWTEEPGGLQSIGLQRVGHDWSDLAHMFGNCAGMYVCMILLLLSDLLLSPLFPPPPIPVTVCLRLPRLHPFLRSMVHPFIHGINTPPSSVPVLWEVRVTALNLQEELEEEARSQGRGSELQAAGAPGCSAQGHKAGTRVAAEPLKPGTSQPVLIPQTCRDQVRGTYHLPVWTSSTGTNFPRFGFCRVSPGPAVGALGLSSGQPGELLKGADSCLQGGSLAETMFHVLRKDRNRVESLPGAGVVELASWWVIMRRFERVVMRSHVVKSAREA